MNAKIMFLTAIFIALINLTACTDAESTNPEGTNSFNIEDCGNAVVKTGLYYEKEDRQYLWADDDSTRHFDITGWTLDACKLRHGVGRENFKALINPVFEVVSSAKEFYRDEDEAVFILDGNRPKVYPVSLLAVHESVNDIANGEPILIVNCFLASLVTVYNRTYCNRVLTFGVSGYTYSDPKFFDNLESFILWDRDTESLWWPIIDKGVSGNFKKFPMPKYSSAKWEIMTMKEVFDNYPLARVLKRGQNFSPPTFPEFIGC